jgi:hypothetical protein
MSGRRPRTDFTQNLEAVARGVRRLEHIQDPILREAVAAALRLKEREFRLDPNSRIRMRNTVLAALAPAKPSLADRVYGGFLLVGRPAPLLVRALVIVVIAATVLGGATVASGDSLPEDAFYSLKLAGEQVRLAIAIGPEDRAAVELSIAEHRLDEAERLATSGREDDAIIATASYGSSLADAAADLASVESIDPRTAALVMQVQTSITASQLRVAATVQRLAADPRTVGTAEVLATVAATSSASKVSPATKIANNAVAITSRLVTVADDRAKLADPKRTETPRASLTPRTDAPPAAPVVALGPTTSTARPSASPKPTTSPSPSPVRTVLAPAATRAAQVPPANASAARQAAEKAREAAQRALIAAEKAKRAGMPTPTPTPTPTRHPTDTDNTD